MSGSSVSSFTSAILISGELASNFAQGDVAINSGDFGILKINAATLNLLPRVIYALWFNGHQVHHIFTNKSSFVSDSHTFVINNSERKLQEIIPAMLSPDTVNLHHRTVNIAQSSDYWKQCSVLMSAEDWLSFIYLILFFLNFKIHKIIAV